MQSILSAITNIWRSPTDEELAPALALAEQLLDARAKAYPLIIKALLEPIVAIANQRDEVTKKDVPKDLCIPWTGYINPSIDSLLSTEAINAILLQFPQYIHDIYNKHKLWRTQDDMIMRYIGELKGKGAKAASRDWKQALLEMSGDYAWYDSMKFDKYDPYPHLKTETNNIVRDFIQHQVDVEFIKYVILPGTKMPSITEACVSLFKLEVAVTERRKKSAWLWAGVDAKYEKQVNDKAAEAKKEWSKQQMMKEWRTSQNRLVDAIHEACRDNSNT